MVIVLLATGILFLLSSQCLEFDRCSGADRAVERICALLLVGGFGLAIVLGWRGKLFGCRRRVREER